MHSSIWLIFMNVGGIWDPNRGADDCDLLEYYAVSTGQGPATYLKMEAELSPETTVAVIRQGLTSQTTS